MKLTVLIFLISFSFRFCVLAQDTVYLDEKFKETVKTAASYYRVYDNHPYFEEYLWVKTYYISDSIQSTATCKTKDCLTKEFHAEWYFENGNKKRECDYVNEKIDGLWTEWYENGNLKEQAEYISGSRIGMWKRWYEDGKPKLEGTNLADKTLPSHRRYTVISHWDTMGKKLVTNGDGLARYYHKNLDTLVVSSEGSYKNGYKTGEWRGYSKLGKLKYKETYIGYEVYGKSWDEFGNEYSYTKGEIKPSFKGGSKRLYDIISRNLKYPKEAKKAKVEGKVFISFVVDELGKVTDAKALNDIGYGCAMEAVSLLRKLPDWNPGNQRGQPKKMRMVLPVTFRLD
ncbi:MAG: TonB family protein [Bacteroidota bacterium]